MRLLLFSDLHCDATAARRLVERSRDVDVLVGAGDFASVRRGINVCIDVLSLGKMSGRTRSWKQRIAGGTDECLQDMATSPCATWLED